MANPRMTRLERIRRKMQQRQNTEEELFRRMCANISKGSLIPIISDTVRNEYIFDIDFDDRIGIAPGQEDISDGAVPTGGDEANDDFEAICSALDLNVNERLTCLWADEVGFPMADRYQIARVAQYLSVVEGDSRYAKVAYLNFLKRLLLDIAREAAETENDDETQVIPDDLALNAEDLSFSEIVSQLGYSRFPEETTDPLEVLARLPIPIYLTTSYHDFMERALLQAGKEPRTQLCLWNMPSEVLHEEHRPRSFFTKDEEAIKRPIVYHLYGLEEYPQSLVLTEDDYMSFLVSLSSENYNQYADGIIPPYLEAALSDSSLLLLGYRLHDWDFRVLFQGLLNVDRNQVQTRGTGVAVQEDPNDVPAILDVEGARTYEEKYLKEAKLRVRWASTDTFAARLQEEWARYQGMEG